MKNGKLSLMSRVSAVAIMAAGSVIVPNAFAQDDDEIVVTARRQAETLIEVPVSVAAFDEGLIEDLGLRSIDDVARHTAGFSFSQAFGRTTERPVIRGAANILAGVQFGVESGAAYFIDGVYYSGDMQALDLRNIERAEVIKGAQSALYGRNTYSGAINFITKKPSQDGFEGSLEALAAEHGETEFYGRISNSIEDGALGFSLSARSYKYDGDDAWVNAADGTQLGAEQTVSINAAVDVNFNENFSVTTRLGYTKDEDGPRPFRLIGAEQNNCAPGYRSGAYYHPTGGLPGFLLPFAPYGDAFPASTTTDNNFQYYCGELSAFEDLQPAQDLDGTPFLGVDRELLFGTTKAQYDFNNGYQFNAQFGLRKQELTTGSDSDHLVGGTDVFPISPFFSFPNTDGNKTFNFTDTDATVDYSGEVRLSSPVEQRFRWSVGAFAYDFSQDGQGITFANGLSPLQDTQTVTNKAVFASASYDVTEQLEVSLEARYQSETKGRTEFGNGPNATPTYQNEGTFEDFIPKVIVSYDINEDSSAYASYAKGVKPGGVNGPIGVATGDEFYDPEESNGFEIGYKARVMDGRGRVGLAAFYNDISKYQLTTPVAGNTGSVNSVATNQGDAKVMGFEFEGSFDFNDYLTVGGTYAYTDAEFTSGCDDFQFTLNSGGFLIHPFDANNNDGTGTIRNPAALGTLGGGLTAPIAGGDPDGLFTGNLSCSIKGNQVPMSSKHQFSAYGNVEVPISDEWGFFANADYTFESSKFVQVHNLAETGSTGILGGNIGVSNDTFRLEVFARNLLDERTPSIATRWFDTLEGFGTIPSATPGRTSIDRSPLGPRSFFLSYRRGRQIGVRATVDF